MSTKARAGASERQEAALARRLDQVTRQMERLERDVGISVETVALFIRYWLMAAPSLPEQSQAAARAKGAERYEGFMQAPDRRLAKGPGFIQEVSLDIRSPMSMQSENGKGPERHWSRRFLPAQKSIRCSAREEGQSRRWHNFRSLLAPSDDARPSTFGYRDPRRWK